MRISDWSSDVCSSDLNSKVYFVPTLLWGIDISKMSNNGYANNIDANPFIINTYIEKQLLKGNNGAIRLHAFDLLDEQVNIYRRTEERRVGKEFVRMWRSRWTTENYKKKKNRAE